MAHRGGGENAGRNAVRWSTWKLEHAHFPFPPQKMLTPAIATIGTGSGLAGRPAPGVTLAGQSWVGSRPSDSACHSCASVFADRLADCLAADGVW